MFGAHALLALLALLRVDLFSDFFQLFLVGGVVVLAAESLGDGLE